MTSLGGGAFTAAQDKARQSVCAQNLAQIYKAIQMFQIDHDSYPRAWFYPPDRHPAREKYNIAKILKPYGADPRLFLCPAAPQAIIQRGNTYLWNDLLNGKGEGSLSNPAALWMMTDMNAATNKVPPAHVGGYNVLYADGHVKWQKQPPPMRATQ